MLSNLRLATFTLTAIVFVCGWAYEVVHPFWSALPLAAFIALVVYHAQLVRRLEHSRRAVAFYEDGLSRLRGEPPNHQVTGESYRRSDHVYVNDLDLFGSGSIFHRMCSARTRAGEEKLASWLLTPAESEEIALRQEAAGELTDALDFREDLALLGHEVRAQVRPATLVEWATRKPLVRGTWVATAALLVAAPAVASLVAWLFFGVSPAPLIVVSLIAIALHRWKGAVAEESLSGSREPERDLSVLATVARRIEEEKFESEWLIARHAKLFAHGTPASTQIGKLDRYVVWLEARQNPLFAPFAYVVLWPVHFAVLIERWRSESGVHVRDWLDAIGEIEAVAALSMYAFERPKDTFPEIADCDHSVYEAEGLGHPMLPGGSGERNDVSLAERPALYVVSGSNMSGKSTLMRSVGVAAVLAYAGAPVCARKLRLSIMAIGASIATHDSIQSGESRFYAEIRRIRGIVKIASETPALFLIDEALHGTNSHDRRIGANAILKSLLEYGAIGFVTTHDLALTDGLDAYGDGTAENWHFEDTLKDGALHFDYTLRKGVVQKSNAIDLMRSIGLDV